MKNYGIFKNDDLLMVVGSVEKAEEVLQNYPDYMAAPVEYIDREWRKINL